MSDPQDKQTQDTSGKQDPLAQAVADALLDEPSLGGYDIHVSVDRDHIILQGVVDVLAEKTRAGQIARTIPGVSTVDNSITISTDGAIKDSDVEFEVAEELNADPNVHLKHVGVEVEGGNARLIGEVSSHTERQAATRAAARARGVRKVLNQLKINDEN